MTRELAAAIALHVLTTAPVLQHREPAAQQVRCGHGPPAPVCGQSCSSLAPVLSSLLQSAPISGVVALLDFSALVIVGI